MDAVDLHNHVITPEVIAFLGREGERYATRTVERDGRRFFLIQDAALRPIDGPISDAPARLADMDREGITTQAVSCVPFLMYPEVPADLGRAIAQVNNDALSAITRSNPERFVALASVPLQDPPGAVRELERTARLGMRGVEIPPKVGAHQLDEPQFEVFWAAAEALGLAVYIHPFQAAPQGALARYFLGNLVGNLYDTGLAAALLIYSGVLERHPALDVVLDHGGGALHAIIGRLDMGYRIVPECRKAIPQPPSTYMRRFSFDIIAHNRPMLSHLVHTQGAERFVIGTDYPLPAGIAHPVAEVRALGLAPADEEKILSANARRLLGPALPAH